MRTLSIILFISLFGISYGGHTQSSREFSKEYVRLQEWYAHGKYLDGQKKINKLLKRIHKGKVDSAFYAATKAVSIRFQEALGFRVSTRTQAQALFASDSAHWSNGDSIQFFTLLSFAELAKSLGMHQQTHRFLNIIDSHSLADAQPWKGFLNETRFQTYMEELNFQQAERLIATSLIDTASLRSDNLSKKQKRLQKEQEDLLAIHAAEIALKRGNYPLADSLFTQNYARHLGNKKSYNYVRNWTGYLTTKIAQEQLHLLYQLTKSRTKFANNMSYAIPNDFYLAIFERDIRVQVAHNQYTKYEKLVTQYQREVIKNYPRKSSLQFHADYLSFLGELQKSKYKSFEKHMLKLQKKESKYFDRLDPNLLDYLGRTAEVQTALFAFDQAEQTLLRRREIIASNSGESVGLYAKNELDIASYYVHYTNKFRAADSIYQTYYQSFVTQELHPLHPDYIRYLSDYALIQEKLDNYDTAIILWQQVVELTLQKYGEKSLEHATSLQQLAKTQIKKGQFYKAEITLFSAKEILIDLKLNRTVNYIFTIQTIGELMAINGNLQESDKMLKEAYELSKRFNNIYPMLPVQTNQSLAEYYLEIGNYDAAQKIAEYNIAFKKEQLGSESASLINSYTLLAKVHLINGNYIESERNADSVISLSHAIYGPISMAAINASSLLADIYFQMGDVKRANEIYENAIHVYYQKFSSRGIALSNLLIGQSKARAQLHYAPSQIIDSLNKASDIVIENTSDQHPKLAEIMEQKAHIFSLNGDYENALVQLQAANFIYVASYGELHFKTADNQVNLAQLFYTQGKYVKAHTYYAQALDIYEKVFNDNHPKYVKTLGEIGKTYYAQKDYSNADSYLTKSTKLFLGHIHDVFPSLSEMQKNAYWFSIKPTFEVYKSLAVTYGASNPSVYANLYNNQLATKSILLNSSVKMKERIFKYGSPELKQTYFNYTQLNAQYLRLLAKNQQSVDSLDVDITAMKMKIQALEKELSESASGFAENHDSKTISWNMVKNKLPSDGANIEIIRLNYFTHTFTDSILYLALVIDKSTKNHPHPVIIHNGNTLEGSQLHYYNNAMTQGYEDTESYAAYWADISSAIRGKKKIFLSADGVYNQVNPETFSATKGTYLMQDLTFYFVSNSKEIAFPQSRNDGDQQKRAVFMGNPLFDSTFTSTLPELQPLAGAEKEVTTLDSLFKANGWKSTLYLHDQATEQALQKLNSPQVLHIATHGYFISPNRMDSTKSVMTDFHQPLLLSGLLLTNAAKNYSTFNPYLFNLSPGILTAYEAMNLGLDETELVFLSACETGKGTNVNGEGVYGLQRAFTIAGAQNVIMSLFKVDDAVTTELAHEFYTQWLQGASKHKALLIAKEKVAKKHPHPAYWGAFKLIGMP